MRLASCIAFILLSLLSKAQSPAAPINGEFVSLKPMANLSPDDPEVKWFHEGRLLVRNNEAILDKVPVAIKYRKKRIQPWTAVSSTYRARFFEKNGHTFVAMRLFQSDYIVVPVPVGRIDPYDEVRVYPVSFFSGRIEIDGVLYKRKALSRATRERLLPLLAQETVEGKEARQSPLRCRNLDG
jgi:hypothetical protein